MLIYIIIARICVIKFKGDIKMDKEYLIQLLRHFWCLNQNQKNGIPCCTIRINDFIVEYTNYQISDGFLILKFEDILIGFIDINDIFEIS